MGKTREQASDFTVSESQLLELSVAVQRSLQALRPKLDRDDIQLLIGDPRRITKVLADWLVRPPARSPRTTSVHVPYEKPWEQAFFEAHITRLKRGILAGKFMPREAKGEVHLDMAMVPIDRPLAEDVCADLGYVGFRPATFEETLAYLAQFGPPGSFRCAPWHVLPLGIKGWAVHCFGSSLLICSFTGREIYPVILETVYESDRLLNPDKQRLERTLEDRPLPYVLETLNGWFTGWDNHFVIVRRDE